VKDVDAAAVEADKSLADTLGKIEEGHRDLVASIQDPTRGTDWGDLTVRAVRLADDFYEITRSLATNVLSTSGARLVSEMRLGGRQTKKESKWVTAQMQVMASITKQLSSLAKEGSTLFRDMGLRLGKTRELAGAERARMRAQILAEAEASILEFRSRTNQLVDELLFTRSELRKFFTKYEI
jgi:hypothetical protein